MIRCIYPGSFDPVTRGHMDMIVRACGIFDEVLVGVLNNPDKHCTFSVEERCAMLQKCCDKLPNAKVLHFSGLLADLARQESASCILRGVRNASDLENETVMAYANHALNEHLETVFLPASPDAVGVSSSLVRQIASFGGDIKQFVPSEVYDDIMRRYKTAAVRE